MNTFDFLDCGLPRATRSLRRKPGFTTIVALTLALGIGATTTLFAIVNHVLIQPLPFPESDRLVKLAHSAQFQTFRSNNINLSSTMYLAYQRNNQTFEQFGLWHDGIAAVTGTGEPEEIKTLTVTYGTLPAVGVAPAFGRWFSQADDSPATAETVILTDGYWQRHLGGDRAILGKTITIDSRPREVIGVMPRGFQFLDSTADVILPQRFTDAELKPNDVHAYWGLARLKPGVTIQQASADVSRMLAIWIADYSTNRSVSQAAHFQPALRLLKQDEIGDIGALLWVLLGTAGIVLLIAVANAANLLLVRSHARQSEVATRAALGATWGRIARESLAESLTLAAIAGALGLGLTYIAIRFLVTYGPDNLPRLDEISLQWPEFLFAAAATLLSALVLGLIPVAKRLTTALSANARTMSQTRSQNRSQGVLVVVQVAMAVVLLIGAGLMTRSFDALRRVAPGFTNPNKIQAVRISIPENQAPQAQQVAQMQSAIVEKFSAIPGVASVGFSSALPMELAYETGVPLSAEDHPYAEGIPPIRRSKTISPGYFRALGTPLIAGRDFTWADFQEGRSVVMISENMAREMWGSPSAALGKRVSIGRIQAWNEVVGVVADVYDSGVQEPAPTTVYWRAGVVRFAGTANAIREVTFAIRTDRTGTESLLADMRAALASVNPNLPLAQVQTMQAIYAGSIARNSFTLLILGIAGSIALSLGVIGIYGVLAYAVAQRRREVGIRLALGARPETVRSMFVRRGLLLAALGIVAGMATAMALTRFATSLLFGTKPLDPATYAVMSAMMLLAALTASYLPARRAASVDPAETLRGE